MTSTCLCSHDRVGHRSGYEYGRFVSSCRLCSCTAFRPDAATLASRAPTQAPPSPPVMKGPPPSSPGPRPSAATPTHQPGPPHGQVGTDQPDPTPAAPPTRAPQPPRPPRIRPTTPRRPGPNERLLTPAEVAEAFRVDPKTVSRWAEAGRLTSIRTLGGHRRFYEHEVLAVILGGSAREAQP
jgi:excisionase family DNA binding protein